MAAENQSLLEEGGSAKKSPGINILVQNVSFSPSKLVSSNCDMNKVLCSRPSSILFQSVFHVEVSYSLV